MEACRGPGPGPDRGQAQSQAQWPRPSAGVPVPCNESRVPGAAAVTDRRSRRWPGRAGGSVTGRPPAGSPARSPGLAARGGPAPNRTTVSVTGSLRPQAEAGPGGPASQRPGLPVSAQSHEWQEFKFKLYRENDRMEILCNFRSLVHHCLC